MNTLIYYRVLPVDDMRDEDEKRIFNAVEENDVKSLKEILTIPYVCRLGPNDTPILWLAILQGARDVVEYLIDNGCDLLEIDKYGNNALHLLVSNYRYNEGVKNRLEIVNLLLVNCPNVVETIFFIANERKMTPFLLACAFVHDAYILRLLALLDNNSISISMDQFIGFKGSNVFHFLASSSYYAQPRRVSTLQALIDKVPFSGKLIDKKNDDEETPLHTLLKYNNGDASNLIELTKIFFQNGICLDTRDRGGRSHLAWAMVTEDVSLVEFLLRAGCRIDGSNFSLLRHILKDQWRHSELKSILKIELLFAFGIDLQKESYLYTVDERPLENAENAEMRDTTDMDPEILEALRELRRSNKLFSLQRQCRTTIRRYLKTSADDTIGNLTCIPNRIKSFLLVKKERPLLEIKK